MEQWLFALQIDQAHYLGLTAGEWLTFIVVIVSIALSFAKLSEQVKELKKGRKENSDTIKELRKDLNDHCDDDEVHINSRIYAELMRRFDDLDHKVDLRNVREKGR